MRSINLIVIGDRACGTTRTYLTYLKSKGLIPSELWLVDFIPAPRLTVLLGELPFGSQIGNIFHRSVKKSTPVYSSLFLKTCEQLQKAVPIPIDYHSDFSYEMFAGKVIELTVEDYNDKYLHKKIFENRENAFLYTNGGIVPANILEKEDLRIFHIHPGIVPEMRGSDCFYWSLLNKGRPGASCFYMSPAIDEGDIIGQLEFTMPKLAFLESICTEENEDEVYRAIAFSFDPHLRAMLFSNIIEQAGDTDLRYLPTHKQKSKEQYHAHLWMHKKIRFKVLKDLVQNKFGQQTEKLEVARND